jgi:hypothetical protein
MKRACEMFLVGTSQASFVRTLSVKMNLSQNKYRKRCPYV